jgi:hypothetical protein
VVLAVVLVLVASSPHLVQLLATLRLMQPLQQLQHLQPLLRLQQLHLHLPEHQVLEIHQARALVLAQVLAQVLARVLAGVLVLLQEAQALAHRTC